MELNDYTTEELKAELKRRTVIEKAKREEEYKNALRCRNCEHCKPKIIFSDFICGYFCDVRTYTVKCRTYNYVVKKHTPACDKFKRKT